MNKDPARRPRRISDEEQVMRTREWVEECDNIRLLKQSIMEDIPSIREIDATYFIATLVIENNLGKDWLNRNVLKSSSSGSGEYLRPGAQARRGKYEHVHRVHELARRIFELGQEDFAPQLLDNLRKRDLFGAVFEADVVRMLVAGPFMVDLREEGGVLGDDYDIDLWLTPEEPWAIEVKTKEEHEPWRAGKLSHSIKRARKQLPAEGKGGVFIRIPGEWVTDDADRRGILDEAKSALQRTSRVQAVVLVWEAWQDNSVGGLTPVRHHRIVRQETLDSSVEGLLAFFDTAWNFTWDIGPIAPF